jgi:uncharacterized Ntn-hydrolase superfamily protein
MRALAVAVATILLLAAPPSRQAMTHPDAAGEDGGRKPSRFTRPVHTYSIVARDPATGEMGVAVQSHWFSVGSNVTWAEAGVGAIATQSFIDPSYGKRGLELMRSGKSAPDALTELLKSDEGRDVRQVAMIDALGRIAAHTGKKCIAAAGHQTGKTYSAQANLMDRASVWTAMAQSFEAAKGDLLERLLAALEAAEREGGDIRGKQSAAILIVKGKGTGSPWAGADRVVDLRVEDHPQPLVELRRLVRVHRAYVHMNNGDACAEKRNWTCALREYGAAEKLMPEQAEIVFWHAVMLVTAGRPEEAMPLFKRVFAKEPAWARLVDRLPASGLLPNDPALTARILAQK